MRVQPLRSFAGRKNATLLRILVVNTGAGQSAIECRVRYATSAAVFIFFKLSDDDMGDGEIDDAIYALEERLMELFEQNVVGEFDGHEWGGGYCQFFMYGPDAEAMTQAILEEVLRFEAPSGSYLVKRFGPQGSLEEAVNLGGGYLSRGQ